MSSQGGGCGERVRVHYENEEVEEAGMSVYEYTKSCEGDAPLCPAQNTAVTCNSWQLRGKVTGETLHAVRGRQA